MVVINIDAKLKKKKTKKNKRNPSKNDTNLTYEPSSIWCSSKPTFVLLASFNIRHL